MAIESPLKSKLVLVVDDEPDVLETVGDVLDMCIVNKAEEESPCGSNSLTDWAPISTSALGRIGRKETGSSGSLGNP